MRVPASEELPNPRPEADRSEAMTARLSTNLESARLRRELPAAGYWIT
jgi:hypothetical protein